MNSSSDHLEKLLDEMTQQNEPQELVAGLEILMNFFNNIMTEPLDDKFRHLKLSDKTLQAKIFSLKLSDKLLKMMGFIKIEDEYYLQDTDLGTFFEGLGAVKQNEMLSQAFPLSDEKYHKAKSLIDRQRQLDRQQEQDHKRYADLRAQAYHYTQEIKHIQSKDSVAQVNKFEVNQKMCEDIGINNINKIEQVSNQESQQINNLKQQMTQSKLESHIYEMALQKFEEYQYGIPLLEYKDLPFLEPHEFVDGSIYIGQWKNGKRHGQGKQFWTDGRVYDGYWEENVAHGNGRLIAVGYVYEGNWLADKADGLGTYTFTDGTKYVGQWKDNKWNGVGEQIWPDGGKYNGDYLQGKRHGKGKYFWPDGSQYEGEFEFNDMQGTGIYKWSDGRKYTGQWNNDKMNGIGQYTWKDGRKYEGEYKDDKKHGYGVYEWPDSIIFKGEWQFDKQHGKGIYVDSQKVEKEGEWHEGKRVRWLNQNAAPGDSEVMEKK